jgi:hypothetical protein
MDSKQLIKIIKVIVEAEVAKKQEHFLSKTFPKILEEEVNRRLNILLETKKNVASAPTKVVKEVDPFQKAEMLLQQERQQTKKQFTKNPTINEILNETQPFTAAQRTAGPIGGGSSILDQFQSQPIQEAASYVPSYMDAEPDIDETITFNNPITAQAGLGAMRNQMAQKMGYGDMDTGGGLGVQTGVSHLDKALNRDYSQLVKRFKK